MKWDYNECVREVGVGCLHPINTEKNKETLKFSPLEGSRP